MTTISITNNIINDTIIKVQNVCLGAGKSIRLASDIDLRIVNIQNSIYLVGDGTELENPNYNLEQDYKHVPAFFVGIC